MRNKERLQRVTKAWSAVFSHSVLHCSCETAGILRLRLRALALLAPRSLRAFGLHTVFSVVRGDLAVELCISTNTLLVNVYLISAKSLADSQTSGLGSYKQLGPAIK